MPNVDSQTDGSSPSFGYSLAGWPGSPEGPVFDYSSPAGSRPSLNCVCEQGGDSRNSAVVTEEHREERRRTWWLL